MRLKIGKSPIFGGDPAEDDIVILRDMGGEPGVARFAPELVVIPDSESNELAIKVHFISRDLKFPLRQTSVGETGLSFSLQAEK